MGESGLANMVVGGVAILPKEKRLGQQVRVKYKPLNWSTTFFILKCQLVCM